MKKIFTLSILLVFASVALANKDTDAKDQTNIPTLGSPSMPNMVRLPILGDRSQLLFDQAPTGTYYFYACQWDSVYPFEAEIADNFTVPFAANVDSLVWWGGYWNGSPVLPLDFWIKIYEDSTGASGPQPKQTPIYVERVPFTETNLGEYYQYTAEIPPFSAQPGPRYWIEFEPTLVFPPQWGNMCSWPGNSPGWGDGQQMYFKSAFFGFPQWATATSIWGNPLESSFQIYGSPSITSYIWDFETGWQGWTKTGAYAFPNGWDVQPAVLHGSWQCPDHGDSSMWFDDDAAGSGAPSLSDTAKSPVVMTPTNMYLLKWGITYNYLGTPEYLEVGLKHRTGGVWSVVPLKTYTTDITSAWDSADVSAYASAESVQVYFYYYDGGGWMWYGAFDNVQLLGSVSLQHDVGTVAILAPSTQVGPGIPLDPQATVKNFGQNPEGFNVYFLIDSAGVNVYNQSVNVPSLDPGQQTTVTFPSWTPGLSDGIVYNITVYTALPGDMDLSNDTLYSQTTVSAVGYWIQCASMPSVELANATGYDPVNDRIYSFGGTPDGGATYHTYTFQYDPVNNVWQTMANMLYGCDWIDASYVNGKFYIFGGYNGTANNWNQIYDIANNSWSTGTALPTAKHSASQVPYKDSLVYFLGGRLASGTATSDVYIYNTYTNNWTTGTSMPVTCHKGGAAIIGDTIYLVGGWDNSGNALSNIYKGVINPTNCEQITWSTGPALPYPVSAAGVIQGQRGGNWYIYLVGGFQNGATPVNDAWEFDVDAGTWNQLPDYTPFAIARNNYLVSRDNNAWEIYVCGGDANGSWTATDQTWKLFWFGYGVEEETGSSKVAGNFGFAPNMPNPTKGSVITYTITKDTRVSLKVYDASGRLIKTLVDGRQTAGTKTVNWNTKNLSSGIYFLRLEAEGKVATHKLILVK